MEMVRIREFTFSEKRDDEAVNKLKNTNLSLAVV